MSIAAEGSDGRSASVPESSAGRSAASSAVAPVESEQAVDGRSASTAESGGVPVGRCPAPMVSVSTCDVESFPPESRGVILVENKGPDEPVRGTGGLQFPSG